MPAVLAGILAVALAATCVLTSRQLPSGGAAALMGVAVGIAYACTAALIKSCTNIVAAGLLALLTSWQPYLLVVAGGIGLLLAQLAFQSGPLTASLPAIATVDPLLSVAIGVWVYDERLSRGPWAVGAEVGCLALMSLAAVMLSRVQAATEDHGRRPALQHSPRRRPDPGAAAHGPRPAGVARGPCSSCSPAGWAASAHCSCPPPSPPSSGCCCPADPPPAARTGPACAAWMAVSAIV